MCNTINWTLNCKLKSKFERFNHLNGGLTELSLTTKYFVGFFYFSNYSFNMRLNIVQKLPHPSIFLGQESYNRTRPLTYSTYLTTLRCCILYLWIIKLHDFFLFSKNKCLFLCLTHINTYKHHVFLSNDLFILPVMLIIKYLFKIINVNINSKQYWSSIYDCLQDLSPHLSKENVENILLYCLKMRYRITFLRYYLLYQLS